MHLSIQSTADRSSSKPARHVFVVCSDGKQGPSELDLGRAMVPNDREERQRAGGQPHIRNSVGGDLVGFGAQFDEVDMPQERTPEHPHSATASSPVEARDALELSANSCFHGEEEHESTRSRSDARSGISHLQLADDSDQDSSQGAERVELPVKSDKPDKARL